MSVFGNIVSAIFGSAHAASATSGAGVGPSGATASPAKPSAGIAPANSRFRKLTCKAS
jgi:hypothetical protein